MLLLDATLTHTSAAAMPAPEQRQRSLEQQLVDERALHTKLGVLIGALEQLDVAATLVPALSEPAVRQLEQTRGELAFQEILYMPPPAGHRSSSSSGGGGSTTILGMCERKERVSQAFLTSPLRHFRTGIQPTPAADRYQFTYLEKKAIGSAVADTAQRRLLRPCLDYVRDKRRERPASFNVFQLATQRADLLAAEQRRLALQAELLAAEQRRADALLEAVRLRCGGRLGDALLVQLRRLELSDVKVG